MTTKHKTRERHSNGMDDLLKRKMIAESAYDRWLRRGASHGADLDDWLEAEQEILKNAYERDREI